MHKNSNNYELIDYFCRIITLNCDALRVEISSTVNPNEVGRNKNRILRISFGFFSVAKIRGMWSCKNSSVKIIKMFISSY